MKLGSTGDNRIAIESSGKDAVRITAIDVY
jgi:hypothetical protein